MSELLAWNWHAFEKLNAIAQQVPSLDPLFRFGANDAIVLSPVLFAVLWCGLARWSPFFTHERTKFGEQQINQDRRLGFHFTLLTPVAIALAVGGNILLGMAIYEPRPFVSHPGSVIQLVPHPADASFPSDHEAFISAAVMMLVFYVMMLLFTTRTQAVRSMPLITAHKLRAFWGRISLATILMIAGILLMVFIGISRVVVGVHYPLDILGGFGVGTLSAAIISGLRRLFQPILDGIITIAERLHLA